MATSNGRTTHELGDSFRFSAAAPARSWHQNPETGLWYSKRWTRREVAEYVAAGGWFNGTQEIEPLSGGQ